MAKPGSHRFITLWRIIKTGGQNFIRNAWLSIAAIAVMIITLGIILFSIIANAAFTNTIAQLTNKIDVSIYLKDSVDEETRDKLIGDLKQIPNVKSVEYVSQDQALADFKEDNENDIDLLLAIAQADNALPASLRIKPQDVNRLDEIRNFAERPEIKALQAEETSYSGKRKDAIDNITRTTELLQRLGLLAVIVFAVVSVLIIFNTIQMAIFNRRDELQIMRLLGASTWYIRGPFIVETVLYGVIAAVISVSICNSLFLLASSTLDASSLGLLDIAYANRYFSERFWSILTLQLGIGILIGAASSFVATRRYLKFKSSK
jgi:cell division transport system permease protein